jgi:hypothetical protein
LDISKDINDTGEELPPSCTIKAHTPQEIRQACEADAVGQVFSATPRRITEFRDAQGRIVAKIEVSSGQPAFIDMREPQEGIALRTFRDRHQNKARQQRQIRAAVHGVSGTLPSGDEKPFTGKTPIRKPASGRKADYDDEEQG